MIVVWDDHGGQHEFDDAVRFATEEPVNNLLIFTGDRGDKLCAVFAEGKWVWVRYVED